MTTRIIPICSQESTVSLQFCDWNPGWGCRDRNYRFAALKINGWNLQFNQLEAGKSSEPNLHGFHNVNVPEVYRIYLLPPPKKSSTIGMHTSLMPLRSPDHFLPAACRIHAHIALIFKNVGVSKGGWGWDRTP